MPRQFVQTIRQRAIRSRDGQSMYTAGHKFRDISNRKTVDREETNGPNFDCSKGQRRASILFP